MQEFLTNNTVSCNLMSLTGYRTLVILEALLESPKSNDEINECLFNNKYIGEKFSSDTLRIYLNSLRAIGCEITRASKSHNKKYVLKSHPFAYDIPKSQISALTKLYKSLYDQVEIKDIIAFENLFKNFSNQVQNKNTKDHLQRISLLKRIDMKILDELAIHCKNKNQITFIYNSPKSDRKQIEIVADKLSFKNEKLYLWGNNLTHKEYSFFSVDRIIEICSIKHKKTTEDFPLINVIYEVYSNKDDYVLEPDEKIISNDNSKIVIETNVKNKFSFLQKILYMAHNCKILKPESLREELLTKLKIMEKSYETV